MPHRNNAPAWPPFKDSYRRLGKEDEIPLRARVDILSGSTLSSALPTPWMASPEPFRNDSPRKSPASARLGIQGWKGGARLAFYTAIVVLLINLILTIVLTSATKWMDGMTMLFVGSCETTQRINAGVHLAINALSTCLLAASNYCMQLLSSPTRADIDKAHARGHWLDIGTPSLRNIRSLSKKKIVLWWVLAVSSIPLHLLYNSVFFSAIATRDYHIIYATPEFVNGAAYDKLRFPDVADLNYTDIQRRAPQFERLDRRSCISEYGQDFVTDRKDVIVVVANLSSPTNSSLLNMTVEQAPQKGFTPSFNPHAWICDDPNTIAKTKACCNNTMGFIPCNDMVHELEEIADTWWRSGGYSIDHCLSERVMPNCHEHFAPQIMAPVLLFNIFKTLVIWYVAFRYYDKPLVTIGDAIDSFIRNPDPTTKHMCLATHDQIEKHWKAGYIPQPQRFQFKPKRWYRAVTNRQWTLLAVLFTIATIGTSIGIGFGISSLNPPTLTNAWNMGMGTVRQQNVISGLKIPSLGANAIFVSALIANTPQALFSFVYLVYNTVFSTMFLGQEWDRFATHPSGRSLRVSDPYGNQKSTYFLQVPYRYAAVMLASSGLLHWLVSQSIFLANISIVPLSGTIPLKDEIISCAYSVRGMIFVLVLGLAMLIWVLGNGMRGYSGLMVMAGSNSAAISAACHVMERSDREREEMASRRLKWGATDFGNQKKQRSMTASSVGSSIFSPPQDRSFAVNMKSSESAIFSPQDRTHPRQQQQQYHARHDEDGIEEDYKKPGEEVIIGISEFDTQNTDDTGYQGAGVFQTRPLSAMTKASIGGGRFREVDIDNASTNANVHNSYNSNSDHDDIELRFNMMSVGQVGHCSFSDGPVGKPVEGRLYA